MLIRRVSLRNVKSYEQAEIAFQPGINFVCGENGAGKTTIIEAIGYCLFGHLPYNLAEFLRNGQGKGSVSVVFTARDGCDYQVTREFDGRASKGPRVADGAGNAVDLHGSADYDAWFRATAGLEADVSPRHLFEQVLGVSQGTFAAPFLQSASVRRTVFDTLFRVNSFRAAHNGALPAVNELRDRIIAREKDEALVAQRLEPLPALRQELDQVRLARESTQTDLASARAALAAAEGEAAALRRLADEVAAAEKSAVALERQAEAAVDRERRLREDIARCQAARDQVEATREAHQRYLAVAVDIAACESRTAELAGLERKLQAADRQLADLAARSEQGEAAYLGRLTELTNEQAGLAGLTAAAEAELSTATAEVTRLAGCRAEFAGCMSARDAVGQAARAAAASVATAAAAADRARDVTERLAELEGRLAARERLLASAAALTEREAGLRAAQMSLANTEERLKLVRDNRSRAEDGLCPFLGVECATPGLDLAARFDGVIVELERQQEAQRLSVAAAEADVREAVDAGRALAALESAATERARMADESRQLDAKARAALAAVSRQGQVLAALAEALVAAPVAAIDAGAGPALAAAAASAQAAAVWIGAGLTEPSAGEAADWLKRARAALEENEQAATVALATLDARLTALQSDASGAVRSLETKLSGLRLQQRANHDALTALAGQRAELDRLKSRQSALVGECERLRAAIDSAGDPRAELTRLREQQATDTPAHELFIRHLPDAERLPALLAEAEAVSALRTSLAKEQEALAARLADLRRQYDPERLAELEQKVRLSHARIAGLEQQLTDLKAREQSLGRQLSELEALQAKQAALAVDLARHRTALTLLEAARQVLNNAGEPVAEHFRRQVAADADRIQRKVAGDAAALVWDRDYEVALIDGTGGSARRRVFAQLSGGEQMTVALALRIALLRFLSPIRVGFFDEPTVNLDTGRRTNLAAMLRGLAGEVGQLFLISHDDTFDAITENVTYLQKTAGATVVREEASR
ncbi:MAG: AAA family ATPase [Chloroflexota bacterium]